MYITIIWFVIWIDAYHIPVSSTTSHHVHCRVVFPCFSYICASMCIVQTLRWRIMHITLCSVQQLLHSVTITPAVPSQTLQKAPWFPSTVLHHSLLALWQLSKWHFMDFMERISQTRNETYFHCLHYTTLCFRKRRWRKLWNQSKIPLNTLKDQMNLNRFIILQKK